SVVSDWVRSEVDWAFDEGKKKIIPVLYRDCDRTELHLKLRLIQYVDFRGDPEPAGRKLLSTLGPESVARVVSRIDDSRLFVTQQYRDFFSREPDQTGLQFWVNEIEQCGKDAACREAQRIAVSTAFLRSVEFGDVGFLIYRFYKAAFGNIAGTPVPMRYQQFVADREEVVHDVVVNQEDWQRRLESNKQTFTLAFVQRAEFQAAYPATLSPAEFVDKLNANVGGALGEAERASLVDELTANNTSAARARVLRKVAENAVFRRHESDRASWLLAYFGYRRRDPDVQVKAFIESAEYRARFCGQ
ncbi:MAG TPA: DUF4214 domain-containing protein, partial [Pyrinomonadaceae bacterium]|nr:DUF4214 domain-containing protein [Pyrinomonadaceae bacterium]